MSKAKPKIDREERRENILRPSQYLGYNHDELGNYFIEREAFNIAEAEFRRAVWLNPYEPEFKIHLAGCLYREQRYAEALELVRQAIAQGTKNLSAQYLQELIERKLQDTSPPANSP